MALTAGKGIHDREIALPRIVLLRHEVDRPLSRGGKEPATASGSHFDWMFERQGVLLTWATEPLQSLSGICEVDAERLADHRLAYLHYEGEISQGRGRVRRVAAGHYEPVTVAEDSWVARIWWQTSALQLELPPASRPDAEAAFYRRCWDDSSGETARAVWRLRFSSCR